MTLLEQLSAPFPTDKVSWRVGSTTKDKKKGKALCYIDARDVMERLDSVLGVEGWQRRYTHADKKTICEIGIKIGEEWVWKADGAGDSDIEAEKGAISDAFKRTAVNFGIGRYLYDVASPWVELDTNEKDGKIYVNGIKAGEFKKLEAILTGKPERKEPEGDPLLAKAQNKVNDVLAVVKDMDTFDLAKWVIDSPKDVDALRWVQRNYPALLKPLIELGLEL